MEKPKSYIHFKSSSSYFMGLLVWGSVAIPVWLIAAGYGVLLFGSTVFGLAELILTNGDSVFILGITGWTLLSGVAVAGLVGLSALFRTAKEEIKKATERESGRKL